MSEQKRPADLLGYAEIAAETGDSVALTRWHRWAKHLPKPDRHIGRSPTWYWSTIRPWVDGRRRQ